MGVRTEIIAYHGWGFARDAWEGWQGYLEPGLRLKAFDRGYFGTPYLPEFERSGCRKIIFAHSYGLHLCPSRQIASCDLLVIFSGFLSFHPDAPRLDRKSRRIHRIMQDRFALEPSGVLLEFMRRCYAPVPYSGQMPGELDRLRLAGDLYSLGQSRICADLLGKAAQIHILHGSRDRIVPESKGRKLFENLPAHARYQVIEDAGHGLPFSHTQQCCSILEHVLRA